MRFFPIAFARPFYFVSIGSGVSNRYPGDNEIFPERRREAGEIIKKKAFFEREAEMKAARNASK
jgi:hypothetical protein